MSTTPESITVTIYRPTTVTVPTVIYPSTDQQTADYVAFAYTEFANRPSRTEHTDTAIVTAFVTAIQEHGAVVVAYTHDGHTDSRVLFPAHVRLTSEYFVTAWAYCTMRQK